jgi:hypothetical protein
MAKRTPLLKTKAADLHTISAQDAVTVNPSSAQAWPPVIKSSGKTKAKPKPDTERDEAHLAEDEDRITTASSEHSLTDTGHDVVLAQANASSSTTAAPASVGEDLLRQAGPLPAKTSAAEPGMTDFIPNGWGMPLAIGSGLLAVAAGGGGGGSSLPVEVAPPTTTFSIVPYAGQFIDSTTNLTAKLYKVSASGVETEIGRSTVVKNGSMALSAKNTDLVLAPGEYLKVKLIDRTPNAPDFNDEAQQTLVNDALVPTQVNLGHELTTLLSTVPPAGSPIAVTQLTTLAANKFADVAATTPPAGISTAIDASNKAVADAFGIHADAFGIQFSLTTTSPLQSPAYKQALGLISGYAKSLGASPTDSKTADVLSDLKTAMSSSDPAAALKTILQTGAAQLPNDYSNPKGSTPFSLSSLELADTNTLVDGKPIVSLVNYSDGLAFKIYPGIPGTHVGDTATLTFTDQTPGATFGATFTYVYTFKGNSLDGTAVGDAITQPETVTIPRYSSINTTVLTEYTDANGKTLLPLTSGGLTDGTVHHYSVDLAVGTLGIGKGLSDFGLNTATVTLNNPAVAGSTVFNASDKITVNVSLKENVQWFNNSSSSLVNGDPTLKLHINDGTPNGSDITLKLAPGFSTRGSSNEKTNVLKFEIALKDLASPLAGDISIPADAIVFPGTTTIMNGPGGEKDTAWFNALVNTTLTPTLKIDTVLPSTASLAVASPDDVVIVDSTGANNGNLLTGDRLTQKNQLSVNITLDDQPLTGNGAKVFLYWSATANDKNPFQLGSEAVTDGNPSVLFDAAAYQTAVIGANAVPSARGNIYYLYTRVVDAAGNEGPLSQPFKVVLDNTAPTAPVVNLLTADDLGQSSSDHITSIKTPRITVTGEKGAQVTLFDDTNSDGNINDGEFSVTGNISTTPDTGTTNKYSYTWTPTSDLSTGVHHFKAKLTDVARNVSALSDSLDVQVLTPLTDKPSLAFVGAPSVGYNTVKSADQTITATVTYTRAMYVGSNTSALTLDLSLAGQARTATYSGISEDRQTLTFTYTLRPSDAGLSGPVSITALNGAASVLQDIAGNPAPSGATPFTATAPTIDTLAPVLPTIAIKDAQANASSVTTDGAVAITAEAGATVTVTFTNTTDATKAPQTVTLTGAGSAEVLAKLNEAQVAALGQGTIRVTAEAKDAALNSSGTTTNVSSFTLDTVAPNVASVTNATKAALTNSNIVFTVKFSEALTTTPTANDFTVVGGLGTITSVVADGANANSYRITVTPKPNTASGQVQLGFSTSSALQDAASNKAADSLAKFSLATQGIDTQAPTVTAVTSSKAGSVANGAFDFIVTFSEAMGPAAIAGNPLSTSNFAVTNGRVTSVTPVATKDGSVQYKVSVTPNNVDAGPNANMVLSLVASATDTDSYVADAQGNLGIDADLSLNGLGGTQAVDTVAPALPSIVVKSAAVNLAKAQAGAVAITAEANADVTVTFTNTTGTTKGPQTVTLKGAGTTTEVLGMLNEAQVTALGQGTIQVKAEAIDAAKNSSGTTTATSASSFTLDTIAPTVRSISSSAAQLKSGGTATVTFTFSEDPGTSFDLSHVTATGGTLSNLSSGPGLTRTATFTADTANLVGQQASITVAANSYTDAALNPGAGLATPASFMFVDTVAPTITGFSSTSSSGTYGIGRAITLRATASETVAAGATLDVTLNNGSTQTVRLSRMTDTLFEGTYTVGAGDSTSANLQVTSFTANGTDVVGNPISTSLPVSSGGGLGATALVIQGIAPVALTSFALNSTSDTGVVGDYITTQTAPGFDLKGLVVGNTVKIYNGNSVVHSFVATSMEMSNIKLPSALSVGNYANLKAVQADAIGNESTALALPQTLQIQSLAAAPAALTELTLDPLLDAQNSALYKSGITPTNYILDNTTFLSAPKFQFKGGTAGNTALLFRDINNDGAYNKDTDIFLGSASIQTTVNDLHSIWIDPTNALGNTPSTEQGYTDIKVVQQDATGQTSLASNAALSVGSSDRPAGLGLVIQSEISALADLTQLALADSNPTAVSNTPALVFTVRGTAAGAKVRITATQTLNGVDKEVTLPDTALTSAANAPNNLVVDVSGFEGTLSNFRAKQTYAGLTSPTNLVNAGSAAPVILDHVAPTVAISTDQTDPLRQDQSCVIKFTFSEVVSASEFTSSDITVSSGTLSALARDTTDSTLWTANYKGVLGNTAPAYIFVGSGKFQDAAGNANTDGADTNNLLKLTFLPVNHAPTAKDKALALNEDTPYTFAESDFSFSDVDGNTLSSVIISTLPTAGTLKLGGTDVTANQVIALSDITKLVYAPAANANGNGYASIGFKVKDNGGGATDTSAEATFTVNVASVNDAPTGKSKSLPVVHGDLHTFAQSDFGFNDVDGNTFSSVIITTLPGAGTLKLNGSDVSAGQSIAVNNIPNLVYTPALNANGDNYATIGFKVQDDGGTLNSGVDTSTSTYTLKINITPINHAPTGEDRSIVLNEDSSKALSVADFGFRDASDTTANGLKNVIITTLPTAGTLKLNNSDVTANQVIAVVDINAGNLKFTPAANASGNGYASIGFKVQDDGGTTNGGADTSVNPNTLTFNVNSVNDAPTATGKALDLNEDTPYTFAVADFSFADANDTPANALSSVIISTLPTAGSLKLNGINVTKDQAIAVADINASNLKFTPAANAKGDGYTNIGFKVKDNGGGATDTSAEASFTVNVASVNDAPTGANKTFTVSEDTSTTLTKDDFGFADANDTPVNALSNVIITSLSVAGALKLNGVDVTANQSIAVADINAGNLKFTPAANANGSGNTNNAYASIDFKVQDDGSTTNVGDTNTSVSVNTLTFNVTPVNDAPTGNVTLGGYTVGIAPKVGDTLTASNNIADVDGIPSSGTNAIHYQWYANGSEIAGATGASFTLTTYQAEKLVTVKALYTDNGGTAEVVAAPTATLAVKLPDTIALSGLSFNSLSTTNSTAVAASNAQLIRGHDGVYLLDVNGDNTIDATDRTTYAQGLDVNGSIIAAGLKFTLLSASSGTWANLSSFTDWPAGDTKGATGVTGNDYWTSTAVAPSSHMVFNNAGNYAAADNAAAVAATRLHYNAFQVIAA